jgi:hypothetical protein
MRRTRGPARIILRIDVNPILVVVRRVTAIVLFFLEERGNGLEEGRSCRGVRNDARM